jgi:hypothetical protein
MPIAGRAGYLPEAGHLRLPGHRDRAGVRGQVSPADRVHLRACLARFAEVVNHMAVCRPGNWPRSASVDNHEIKSVRVNMVMWRHLLRC